MYLFKKIDFNENREFHKKMAKIPFEEKVKIIVELKKINNEFRKNTRKISKNIWIFDNEK